MRNYSDEASLRLAAASLAVAEGVVAGDTLVFGQDGAITVGSTVHSQNAMVTSDETFLASYVFDLGHATVAYVSATLLSADEDGEVFALDHLYGTATTVDSRDSNSFDPLIAVALTPALAAVDDVAGMSVICSRYLQATVEIDDADNGDVVYAGGNMPVVSVRFDVEYL